MESVKMLEHGLVRVKDLRAPGGLRIPEQETVKSDFVNKFQNLSPGRQKLMEKYFTLGEPGEHCPFLAEYFAVALAFTALGALLRETNGPKPRKHSKDSGDRGDYQGPPKLRRMALEAMLKEAMDRLKVLAEKRKYLEERARERGALEAAFQKERIELLKRATRAESLVALKVESEAAWTREKEELLKRVAEADAQRGYFFKHMTESETHVAELQKLRAEDGKANARLVGIYASREQGWKLEKVRLSQDIEALKERNRKLNGHVKALALHSEKLEMSPEAQKNRNLRKVKDSPPEKFKDSPPEKVHPEKDFKVVTQTMPAAQQTQPPIEKTDITRNLEKPAAVINDDDQIRASEAPASESVSQQQEMEAELASILKRVGQLKRRGTIGKMVSAAVNNSIYEDSKTKETFNPVEEASIKDGKVVRHATQELQLAKNFSSPINRTQPMKVDAITQALDTLEKSYKLDDTVTKKSSAPVDGPMNSDAVKCDDNQDNGSKITLERENSLERLEKDFEAGTESFLTRKTSLERLDDELGNVVLIPSDVLRDSSERAAQDEVFLEPTLVDMISAAIVGPDDVDAAFPTLSALKSVSQKGDKVGGLEDACKEEHTGCMVEVPDFSTDKPQEDITVQVDSVDKPEIGGISSAVQEQEEYVISIATEVPEQQRGDVIVAVLERSLRPPADEVITDDKTITYNPDHEVSQSIVEAAQENCESTESVGGSTQVKLLASLEDDVVQEINDESHQVSIDQFSEGVQPLAESTWVIEQELVDETIAGSEECSDSTQSVGITNKVVLQIEPESEASAVEAMADPQEIMESSVHNDVSMLEDGSLNNSVESMQTPGTEIDIASHLLSEPHLSTGVPPNDDVVEDLEVFLEESSAKAVAPLQISSQDPDLSNGVLVPDDDLIVDMKASSEEGSAGAVEVLQTPSESPLSINSEASSEEAAADVAVFSERASPALSLTGDETVTENITFDIESALTEDIAGAEVLAEKSVESSATIAVLSDKATESEVPPLQGSTEAEALKDVPEAPVNEAV